MPNYETTFVLKPDLEKEAVEKALGRIKKAINGNDGEITEVEDWGSRKLAYEINDYRSGYYTVINFTAGADAVNELERIFKITGEVLRYLIVRQDD